jgi:hypothetical protein
LVSEAAREDAMTQNGKQKVMPSRSREWLEAEGLKLAQQMRSGRGIERITLRRLGARNGAPNWKIADLIPQPEMQLGAEVRAALAHLPGKYALEGERD